MNAAHLHLLVNHLPIVGFAFGLMLLAATILRRGDRGMFVAAVLVVVISGAGGLAAQLTGEPAEEVVEHLADVPQGFDRDARRSGIDRNHSGVDHNPVGDCPQFRHATKRRANRRDSAVNLARRNRGDMRSDDLGWVYWRKNPTL